MAAVAVVQPLPWPRGAGGAIARVGGEAAVLERVRPLLEAVLAFRTERLGAEHERTRGRLRGGGRAGVSLPGARSRGGNG